MAEGSSKIRSLDSFLEHYDGDTQLRIIANEGLEDSASKTFIADFFKIIGSLYENFKTTFIAEGWDDEQSETSCRYRDNSKLEKHFLNFCTSRRELLRITESAANDLDTALFTSNISRIIGSAIEILSSLNLGICYSITSYAYNISSYFGFIMENALELALQLRFMGFVGSFLYILRSQVIVSRVVRALKKDREMFTPLKEWFDEAKELDELVQNLFPHGINEEITKSIEYSLENLGKEEEIFSVTVLSNLMEDPTIYKNRKFMIEAYLFSTSDAGKEWYKRFRTGAYNLDEECEMFYLNSELLQLEEANIDSASTLELGKCIITHLELIKTKNIWSNLGRLFICGMSGMSIFYSYQNIRAGSKHRYSNKLRTFSEKAQAFLNNMEKIRFDMYSYL